MGTAVQAQMPGNGPRLQTVTKRAA